MDKLESTVNLMLSDDYEAHIIAEYHQVVIRFKKLKDMLDKWDRGTLEFLPRCPRGVYNIQIRAMADYIAILEARAAIEGIAL